MTETSLSKWELAISRLIEFTQDGNLKWKIVYPEDFLPKSDTTGAMLIVKYNDIYLLLCRRAFTRLSGGLMATISGSGTEVKDYRPELSIYDTTAQETIYTFPYSELVNDLYKAATYSTAKVDELISNILGDISK
jgi:hypothetical protein